MVRVLETHAGLQRAGQQRAAPAAVASPRARTHVAAGHTIVADEREGEDEDLPAVGRVGQRLRVADHARVEDELASHALGGAEGDALDDGAILNHERRVLRRSRKEVRRGARAGGGGGSGGGRHFAVSTSRSKGGRVRLEGCTKTIQLDRIVVEKEAEMRRRRRLPVAAEFVVAAGTQASRATPAPPTAGRTTHARS